MTDNRTNEKFYRWDMQAMNEERLMPWSECVSINAIIRFCEDVYNLHIIKNWHFSISHGMFLLLRMVTLGHLAQFIQAEKY
jgi:hypothetical protein